MAVSEHDVRHIAALARLGLDPDRVQILVNELNGILGHMDLLSAVDTTGVPDDAGARLSRASARPDAPDGESPAVSRETIAPAMRDGFFLVPRLATHEDAEDS